ncbi:MAG TPA: hypothetical protein VK562_02335 [Candidatus Acidoferrum sp.]|nr:hypothetical protein [Candidatus Acidoferrum sp.]
MARRNRGAAKLLAPLMLLVMDLIRRIFIPASVFAGCDGIILSAVQVCKFG